MYNVSESYNEAAFAPARTIQVKAIIGSTTLTGEQIKSFSVDEGMDSLAIGATASAKMELSFISTPVNGNTCELYVGFNNEYCPMGIFTITDTETNDFTVRVTGFDKMASLGVPYTPSVTFPATISAILNDIATHYSFTIAGTIPSLTINEYQQSTVREMIGYIAGLMGKNARFNRDGQLEFMWFNLDQEIYGDANEDGSITQADVTYINSHLLNSVTDARYEAILGRMIVGTAILGTEVVDAHKALLSDVNEDNIVTSSDVAEIQAYINGSPYPGTLVGTVGSYRQMLDDETIWQGALKRNAISTYTISSLVSGTAENPIVAGTGKAITFYNPYMTQERLTTIKNSILPFVYMAGEIKHRGNPAWEVGDIVAVKDSEDNIYRMPIMTQNFAVSGGLNSTFTSLGMSDERTAVEAGTSSPTEIMRTAAGLGEKIGVITDRLNNSEGLLGGSYKELFGTDIDPSALAGLPIGWRVVSNSDPNKYWQMTYNGLAFTQNGGQTYEVGITMDGEILANEIATASVITNTFSVGDPIHGMHFDGTTGKLSFGSDVSMTWGALPDDVMATSDVSTTGTGVNKITTINGTAISTGTITADKITAGTISGAVEATNFTMSGGKINVVTTDSNNVIDLQSPYSRIYIAPGYINLYEKSGTSFLPTVTLNAQGGINGESMTLSNPGQSSTGTSAIFTTGGALVKSQQSSRRYKTDIKPLGDWETDIKSLYDIPVERWRYIDGYLPQDDPMAGREFFGLIAEDIEDIPTMTFNNEQGQTENYRDRQLINALLVLVQDLNKRVKELERGE